MTIPEQEQKQELEDILRQAIDWHGHFGPFLVLGVKMGLIGIRERSKKWEIRKKPMKN